MSELTPFIRPLIGLFLLIKGIDYLWRPMHWAGRRFKPKEVIATREVLVPTGGRRPSDEVLLGRFAQGRATFEEMRRMFEEDAHLRQIAPFGVGTTAEPIANNRPDPRDITGARWTKYLELFETADVSSAIRGDDGLKFFVATSGFASKGYRIAVMHSTNTPAPLLASLDDFRRTGSGWEVAYRRIEGDWYLYLIW